jgi:starch-binding outer membrane protein, SusD/RagB family
MKNERTQGWMARAAGAAVLGAVLGGCDFIDITDANPNVITRATAAQLFTSVQVNSYLVAEGHLAHTGVIWMQQLAGVDRQFATLDTYEFANGEAEYNPEWTAIYGGGGMIDVRRGQALADSAGCRACSGLFQVMEAYLVGTAASAWGDVIYSQALDLETYPVPVLDEQAAVYAALQTVLDGAIANLAAGGGAGAGVLGQMSAADFSFGGDLAAWRAAAHTLKARYYMHWVEAQRAGGASAALAQTACGGDCVAKALASAQQGISSPAGDWTANHGTSTTENNLWHQFLYVQRQGYVLAGDNLVSTLQSRGDPRLGSFFTPDAAGGFSGSQPGASSGSVSGVSRASGSPAASDYDQPIVSCAENEFIRAEAHYYQGATGEAQSALAAGAACESTRWGAAVPVHTALAGPALLEEIITQKYVALFLNLEVWNDYKRTCLPALATYNGQPIPGRLIYPAVERNSNPNVPPPGEQPARNDNDPAACASA